MHLTITYKQKIIKFSLQQNHCTLNMHKRWVRDREWRRGNLSDSKTDQQILVISLRNTS